MPSIIRKQGRIIQVGYRRVKNPSLPDWDLVYIEYPLKEKEDYREALQRESVKIVKVTKERIYFEQ